MKLSELPFGCLLRKGSSQTHSEGWCRRVHLCELLLVCQPMPGLLCEPQCGEEVECLQQPLGRPPCGCPCCVQEERHFLREPWLKRFASP